MTKIDKDTFFNIRDEIIDCIDDVDDFLVDSSGQAMHTSVARRLSNVLELLEDIRKSLGIKDRPYESDV